MADSNVKNAAKSPMGKAMMAVAGLVFLAILYFTFRAVKNTYTNTASGEPWLVETTKSASKGAQIPGSTIPRSNDGKFGLEFSYSFWMYLDGWEDNSTYTVPYPEPINPPTPPTPTPTCKGAGGDVCNVSKIDCFKCSSKNCGWCITSDNLGKCMQSSDGNTPNECKLWQTGPQPPQPPSPPPRPTEKSLTSILYKGDSSATIQAPGIWLQRDKIANDIRLIVKTNTYYTYPDCQGESCYLEKCSIGNIPVNKWVHITVSVINRYLDIYVNGFLKKRCLLNGLPKQNDGDIYINSFGGFNGYLSRVRYYNYALPIWKIEQVVKQGPSTYVDPNVSSTVPPYLAYNWWEKGYGGRQM